MNFVTLLEWLLSCAKQVHHTAECPAVDLVVSVQLVTCFWGTPLFQTSATPYFRIIFCLFESNVEVDHFDFDCFKSFGLRFHVFVSECSFGHQNVIWLEVSMTNFSCM